MRRVVTILIFFLLISNAYTQTYRTSRTGSLQGDKLIPSSFYSEVGLVENPFLRAFIDTVHGEVAILGNHLQVLPHAAPDSVLIIYADTNGVYDTMSIETLAGLCLRYITLGDTAIWLYDAGNNKIYPKPVEKVYIDSNFYYPGVERKVHYDCGLNDSVLVVAGTGEVMYKPIGVMLEWDTTLWKTDFDTLWMKDKDWIVVLGDSSSARGKLTVDGSIYLNGGVGGRYIYGDTDTNYLRLGTDYGAVLRSGSGSKVAEFGAYGNAMQFVTSDNLRMRIEEDGDVWFYQQLFAPNLSSTGETADTFLVLMNNEIVEYYISPLTWDDTTGGGDTLLTGYDIQTNGDVIGSNTVTVTGGTNVILGDDSKDVTIDADTSYLATQYDLTLISGGGGGSTYWDSVYQAIHPVSWATRVGIGTLTPSDTFHVVGNTTLEGELRLPDIYKTNDSDTGLVILGDSVMKKPLIWERSSGSYSAEIIGRSSEASGAYAVSAGLNDTASGAGSFTIGYRTKAEGMSSFAGGSADFMGDAYTIASGAGAFNYSVNYEDTTLGAAQDRSFILGGTDNTVEYHANGLNSGIIGGASNWIEGNTKGSVIIGGNGNRVPDGVDYSLILGGGGINATQDSTVYTYRINTERITIPRGANNGYVLTSDGSGVATWQAVGGGSSIGNPDSLCSKQCNYYLDSTDMVWKKTGTVTHLYTLASGSNAGSVGIGTSTAPEKLTVNGNTQTDTIFAKHDFDDVYNRPTTLAGYGITDARSNGTWQYELSANSENNFTISFTLQSTSIISYNGDELPTALWSGEGTTTLNLTITTYKYDKITVIQ